ncbi:MAG: prepilin-type N-terminal cleavage/methylation domain-containing protein [Opitutaceae bacterium]|nr:prepilin-type N-terminal cleavage/methylation domain-containing protein [Opitutaceae bacterium]
MTTSTPPIDPAPAARSRCAAFTLVEVMVAAALGTMVLAGVLSAFLFIGRTGFNAGSYSEMEAQTRRALDRFAADARRATAVQWHSSRQLTFTLPTAGSGTTQVTYAYDAASAGATARSFYRHAGDAASAAPREVLVRGVGTDFAFARFKLEQNGVTANAAANDLETKLVQVNLRPVRTGVTAVAASQNTLSARYLLRNKRVSQ